MNGALTASMVGGRIDFDSFPAEEGLPMDDAIAVKMETLKLQLKPETLRCREAIAAEQARILQAIEQARANGASEKKALAQYAPDWPRSTYHGRRRRFLAGGAERLINQRPGNVPAKLTPEVCQLIVLARRIDSEVSVERIGEILQAQLNVSLAASTIRKILHDAGLNRPNTTVSQQQEPSGWIDNPRQSTGSFVTS